jgi:hypothetical protein
MAKNHMKSQGPRTNGQYKQGYYRVLNTDKYTGDLTKVIYRSSWEAQFMRFCDTNPNIIGWTSEPDLACNYYDPLLKKMRKYYIDFAIVAQDNDGNISKWFIEIKPNKQIVPPTTPKRMTDKQTANFLHNAKAYIVNQAKFEAAKQFAAERGFKFGIVTENFLFKGV